MSKPSPNTCPSPRQPAGRATVLVSAVLFALAGLLGGCASLEGERADAVPTAGLANAAALPNMPGVRSWADEAPIDVKAAVRKRVPGIPRLAQKAQRTGGRPVVEILALSGGGRDGAFGAGVLAGWTARGNRPEFEVVTGVSAGAIIAPFAFLGPKWDDKLKQVWTAHAAEEIATPQLIKGLFGGGSALADTKPLERLIAQYVDRTMLDAIAAEYRKGRILMVITTNLDAQRPMIWNLGEIAASRQPGAIELFRKVILASSAIPGAFPPVEIQVSAGGRTFTELHVDGGTTREVFILPVEAPLSAYDALYETPPARRIYLIQNNKRSPEYSAVKKQTIPIAMRAIATLIKNQSRGDIYRIYRTARDGGADFNYLSVPETFEFHSAGVVDQAYQSALFDVGAKVGRSGRDWAKAPPDVRLDKLGPPAPVASAGTSVQLVNQSD
jgi:predicted acylesterase/phospholipase RssA